jgi:hypothetical protein
MGEGLSDAPPAAGDDGHLAREGARLLGHGNFSSLPAIRIA